MKKCGSCLIWCKAMVMGMWSDGIVEAGDAGNEALLELFGGLERTAVQLFLFQIFEKAFHDRVVIRMPFCGEGLDHAQLVSNLAKVCGSKLAASIRVEQDAF